jgi:hypothetical protein
MAASTAGIASARTEPKSRNPLLEAQVEHIEIRPQRTRPMTGS